MASILIVDDQPHDRKLVQKRKALKVTSSRLLVIPL